MKSFHAGWAARNALIVIGMAQHGISAHRDAMDGKNGFFQAYGREDADIERASELLGSSFALVEHGLGMKKFPCVNAAIRPLAGLLELKRRHSLRANQVKRIVCVLPPGSMKPMHHHRPETGLEGQFSLEYVLAAGLLDDRIGIATFTDEMVQRPAIRSLLGLVEAVEDPRCIADDPLAETRGPGPRGFVEVHVTASSGEMHKTCVRVAPGYPGNDLSRTEMWEKFHDCAQYASINSASAQSAFDALMQLEDLTDVSEVLRLMHPSTKEG
jgi:2-methylcitrate dehydratase PrpD